MSALWPRLLGRRAPVTQAQQFNGKPDQLAGIRSDYELRHLHELLDQGGRRFRRVFLDEMADTGQGDHRSIGP